MSAIDPRIDDYIAKSANFAKPILNHLREIIHMACPKVKETMKWSHPHYDYNGSILCSTPAFKQHCTLGFWLSSEITGLNKTGTTGDEKSSRGNFGHLKTLKDLPSDKLLIRYIKEAMLLIDKGMKMSRKEKVVETKETEIPKYFTDALKQDAKANSFFKKFSPSQKKEYVEWITGAKSETTRDSRMATALEWIAEGKSRHWKYQKR